MTQNQYQMTQNQSPTEQQWERFSKLIQQHDESPIKQQRNRFNIWGRPQNDDDDDNGPIKQQNLYQGKKKIIIVLKYQNPTKPHGTTVAFRVTLPLYYNIQNIQEFKVSQFLNKYIFDNFLPVVDWVNGIHLKYISPNAINQFPSIRYIHKNGLQNTFTVYMGKLDFQKHAHPSNLHLLKQINTKICNRFRMLRGLVGGCGYIHECIEYASNQPASSEPSPLSPSSPSSPYDDPY